MKEKEEKKSMNVHIIHSVKGGSGKTAYSLFKAMKLAIDKADKSENKAKVLYVDADFKGTAIKSLIYGKDLNSFSSINNSANYNYKYLEKAIVDAPYPQYGFVFNKNFQYKNLNDFLNLGCKNIIDLIVHGGLIGYTESSPEDGSGEFTKKLAARLDFLFSSPNIEDKNKFRYLREKKLALLSIGLFSDRIKTLLFQILKSGQYDDVVIDMPPGDDEYSDILLDTLRAFSLEEIKRNIYRITTNDISHLDAEEEAFVHSLKKYKNQEEYEKYIMVYNEFRKDEFKESILEGHIERLKELLNSNNSANQDKVYYDRCIYNDEYYNFCRTETVTTTENIFSLKLGDTLKKLI